MEAKRLKAWHVDLLREAKTQRMYFAYDNPSDWKEILNAGKLLRDGGISKNKAKCYVLAGFDNDTFEDAEKRFHDTWEAGFTPYIMQYMDDDGNRDPDWHRFLADWKHPRRRAKMLDEGRLTNKTDFICSDSN